MGEMDDALIDHTQVTSSPDDLAPDTANAQDQDLLGVDDSTSNDISDTSTEDTDDQHNPLDIIDEGVRYALAQDMDRGIELIQERANKVLRGQNKSYTKKMQNLAKASKDQGKVVEAYKQMDAQFRNMSQKHPEFAERFVKLMKGEDVSMPDSNSKEPSTVKELLGEVKKMIQSEVGGLRGDYQGDQSSREVGSYFTRLKSQKFVSEDRLSSIQDQVAAFKAQNPNMNMKQAIGAVDPDLLGDLVHEARTRANRPAGGERTLSEYTTTPTSKKFTTLDDAFEDAFRKHGHGVPD